MDYGYKITTRGRRLLVACLDLGKPLKLTRAAVGGGLINEDEDLAKVHDLIHYIADATITDRRHEEDRLFLTVRYSNKDHPETGAFTLSEFMVWAEDPVTGQETDFLYATLWDLRQPVPGYSDKFPASVWTFPLVLAVSSELQVIITASPGLVTFEDLLELKAEILRSIMMNEVALPLLTVAGEPLLTNGGTPIWARYILERSSCVMAALEGRLAETAGSVAGQIAAAKQEAVRAAGAAADAKITAHNAAEAAHPSHLAIAPAYK